MGDELRKSARNAIIIAMFLIGTYITFRFDSFYALGSLIALIHDISITLSFLIFFFFFGGGGGKGRQSLTEFPSSQPR